MSRTLALVVRILVVAVALGVTAKVLGDHIRIDDPDRVREVGTLIGVALIFGIVNAVVKPVVKVLGCPLYVLTLGLFGLVVNAALFLLVAYVAERLGLRFFVENFGWALIGAIFVSIVAFVLHLIIPDSLDRR